MSAWGGAPLDGPEPRPDISRDARGKLINVNILYGINTVTEALKARGRNFEWVRSPRSGKTFAEAGD
jgi:hypothetical protein